MSIRVLDFIEAQNSNSPSKTEIFEKCTFNCDAIKHLIGPHLGMVINRIKPGV